ncbi:MAG: hypothetical protein BV456_00610 [Thermoplasmata archaeon M8B2D]|nr:MAG: hypothetical protein BV456_00610 [Thermoplasmata archaeon M8B2D]
MIDEKREEIMEKVVEAAENYGLRAKSWIGGSRMRVYLSRQLSKGRQDIGYVEIESDGSRSYNLIRNKAGIRDSIEAVL